MRWFRSLAFAASILCRTAAAQDREPCAEDVAGAPVPGAESGRTDPSDDGDSVAREVGRGALFVPKIVLDTALQPVRGGDEVPITGARPGEHGHACAALPALAPSADGYTIVRVETMRPDFRGETFVHVARDPATGAVRVIGIWRN